MAITASEVKALRDATNVSMMECKRALVETDGDLEGATKLLRERGMAVAAKRATKAANQGIITATETDGGKTIAMVEVNCETDFVARNEDFQKFVADAGDKALATDDALSDVMADELVEQIAAIGENLKIRRNLRYQLSGTGKLASYIHLGGKVGVVIEVACGKEETATSPVFEELVKDLTLHIAAAAPPYLTSAEIPADVIAEERAIFAKQVEGKPEQIIGKIVDGKVEKFYAETCLVNQGFVKEPKQSITQLLEAKGKELSDTFEIKRFERYQLGA
ncbi:MAG: translation elongation factor Ts [Verrucomicrobia bacterium]|jgi:elongation factor Ts|nr:translation elongation factor Ts [Verrucomicrobiota bacterium]